MATTPTTEAHDAERQAASISDRVPLLFGPSPVHRLERLSEHLGGTVELWAKRRTATRAWPTAATRCASSSTSPPTRSRRGATRSSRSAPFSRTTPSVAAVAARLGLRCVLVQEHWVDWPDAVYDKVGNILLSRIMGADVRLDPSGFDIGIRKSWEDALASVEEAAASRMPFRRRLRPPARRTRLRSLGGRGGRAGARARRLLRHRRRLLRHRLDAGRDDRGVRGAGARPCRCSGSTARRRSRRPGLRSPASPASRPRRSARTRARRLGDRPPRRVARGHVRDPGREDDRGDPAVRPPRGMLTDPVYEGKSMAALIDLVRSGRIAPGSRVLYAHLGGQPALNAYAGAFWFDQRREPRRSSQQLVGQALRQPPSLAEGTPVRWPVGRRRNGAAGCGLAGLSGSFLRGRWGL